MAHKPKVTYLPQSAGAKAANWLRTLSFLVAMAAYYTYLSDYGFSEIARKPTLLFEVSNAQYGALGMFALMLAGYIFWLADHHSVRLSQADTLPFAIAGSVISVCIAFIAAGGIKALSILWDGDWGGLFLPVGFCSSIVLLLAISVGIYWYANRK